MQLFEIYGKIFLVIKMCNPFDNIPESEKALLLEKLESHMYKFNKNEEVLPMLINKNIICILTQGSAKIINTNYLGEEVLIDELHENSVFGTNTSNIEDAENSIIATDTCEIVIIDYNKLMNPNNLNSSYYNVFIFNLFQILNDKLKENNDRIQILTKKNIRDKLLAFFENEYRKTRSQNIYLKGTLKNLSDYLSVNRSAMFRELKNLKEEKFVKIDNKRITLLYVPNIK